MSTPFNPSTKIKKILGESAVIIFSVLLALFANEWRSNVKEARKTQVILDNIELEMKDNQRIADTAFAYHKSVFGRIQEMLDTDSLQQLFNGYYFDDYQFAPKGIMREGFNNIAWIVAKEERIATRIGFQQSEALYEAYKQQETVEETLKKISQLLFDRTTHRQASTQENIILLALLFNELTSQEEELQLKYKQAREIITAAK